MHGVRQLRNVALAVFVFSVGLLAAESPFAGTWKMNADKSKLAGADALQNVTAQYEVTGGTLKATVQGTSTQGQPVNFNYEAKLDGTPGTSNGSDAFDTITLQRVSTHVLKATAKKGGKVVYTDRRVVSKDGKTLTISRSGTDTQGKPFRETMVFDKQ